MSKKSTDQQDGTSEAKNAESGKTESQPVKRAGDDNRRALNDGPDPLGQDEQAAATKVAGAAPRQGGGGVRLTATFAFLVALATAGFTAWQAYESRREKAELELELARKLAEIEAIGSDSRRLSSAARDTARDVEARLGQLDARLVGIQNQRLAVESLYEELSQSRDEWTLAEVEQILLVASQQLQLAGNVQAALIALQAADARLARSDRPQLTKVRRAIADDIERLKSSPFVDVTGIGLKLEHIIDAVDVMPLATETRPVSMQSDEATTATQGWRVLLAEVWDDLRSLVRIQRVDSPGAPLLAPDQAFFLRENLKLRLLSARLDLLARDQVAYKTDLTAAADWLTRYFDTKAPAVASSTDTLDQLAKSDIRIALPDVSASLDAVRNYRLVKERAAP